MNNSQGFRKNWESCVIFYLLFGTARTKGTRLGTGTRRTKGTIRTGLARFTRGGLLTNLALCGNGARGAKRALTETGALGAMGARGALLKLKYRGTERTLEVEGTVGTGRNAHRKE